MASTDSNPTATDPVTPTQEPIKIIITDSQGGILEWTPGDHGQEHLRSVPEEDRQRVNDEVEATLQDYLQGLTGAICGAVHPEIKDLGEELVALLRIADMLVSDPYENYDPPFGDEMFGPFGNIFGPHRFGGGF